MIWDPYTLNKQSILKSLLFTSKTDCSFNERKVGSELRLLNSRIILGFYTFATGKNGMNMKMIVSLNRFKLQPRT